MLSVRSVLRSRKPLLRAFSAAAEEKVDDSALMKEILETQQKRRYDVLPPHATTYENAIIGETSLPYPKECAVVNAVGGWTKGRKAIIFMPARNQMQSGDYNTHHWEIRFGTRQTWQNPLMGWTSGADPIDALTLKFNTKEEALEFAQRQGWSTEVMPVAEKEDFDGKIAYSHNFLPLDVENKLKKYGKKAAPHFKHAKGGHSHWVKTLKYHGNGEVVQHGGDKEY
ncbi:NADH dehydrogenase, ubiquinone iron-sulfur protein 4 [Thraustotheca clavata]|uniref:NADH dehydrogenase [ubiquinone] iron-sulfur protein 4, mitochondrial n=1 Tax=Thraustotheca clavata TaxID=74557 RepID=A0A1V9YYP1_9STRA|nr:NADH dehydrogenase, ubiquinone iron-sulfur protein 4 [Thraustotheca clavata]